MEDFATTASDIYYSAGEELMSDNEVSSPCFNSDMEIEDVELQLSEVYGISATADP